MGALDIDKALELKQSALLNKVFPPAVAAALLEDRAVEPQARENTTLCLHTKSISSE